MIHHFIYFFPIMDKLISFYRCEHFFHFLPSFYSFFHIIQPLSFQWFRLLFLHFHFHNRDSDSNSNLNSNFIFHTVDVFTLFFYYLIKKKSLLLHFKRFKLYSCTRIYLRTCMYFLLFLDHIIDWYEVPSSLCCGVCIWPSEL